MKRATRKEQAMETVAICEQGFYAASGGRRVDISNEIAAAKSGTRLYALENTPAAASDPGKVTTKISVANETAFSAIRRLAARGAHVGCLNFASAKNPGGGFLGGAEAQEEALARASALYPCLLKAPEYYERNRANRSSIYLECAIFSPRVPFFRDDEGVLLEEPVLASVITAPAPNAGAVAHNEPQNLPQVAPALSRRAQLVLQIARAHGIEQLVLGAWGCGVFRNDPALVVATFAQLLLPPGMFYNVFEEVVFAVYDRTDTQTTFHAFDAAFAAGKELPRT